MTNTTTKGKVHALLSKLAEDKKKEARRSFIRPEASGGFDKLSSQGVGKSETQESGGEEE